VIEPTEPDRIDQRARAGRLLSTADQVDRTDWVERARHWTDRQTPREPSLTERPPRQGLVGVIAESSRDPLSAISTQAGQEL
jgi:hypothetical protein